MCCALFVFYFNCDVGVLRTICFLLSLLRWCFMLNLGSTLTNTWVFCAQFVFYFHYHVGVLRSICFLLIITFVFCALFSTLTNTWVFCALFVFYFHYYLFSYFFKLLRWHVAHYLLSSFFNYQVGVLRTICFLL